MPLPMPWPAPVTMATFSLSCFMWCSSRGMPQRRVRAILRNLAKRVRGAFAERWGFAGEGIPIAARPQGVDLIKLMVTGGVLDAKEKGVPGELKMDPAMVCAARSEPRHPPRPPYCQAQRKA